MPFAFRKTEAVLVYLACCRGAHSREKMAGLLWGEATEANARASLRKALTQLRQRVSSHLIITRYQVAFFQERPHWLDSKTFTMRINAAIAELPGPLTDESASALSEAVELYQGDFLEGFYVRRAPAFEEWMLLERERLRLLALRALHELADYFTAQGTYRRAIEYTARLLALEPGQEEAHREMMILLALSGQQGAALRQYTICRQALATELGVEPEEETTALYERIRVGAPLPTPSRLPPHNLPSPPTRIVGRQTELAELKKRLRDPDCRLLTLLGPGGVGKTRLALEVASKVLGDYGHGVFFVSLAPLESDDAVVSSIAQALNLAFHNRIDGDPESSLRSRLLEYLREKTMLLILDSFEHLISTHSTAVLTAAGEAELSVVPLGKDEAGTGLVTDILNTAPAVRILVTSRTRLDVQAEHLFAIGGLDYPDLNSTHTIGIDSGSESLRIARDAEQCAAVQLFLQCARRVQPDFEPDAADLSHIVRICHLVQGIPLGILLAAAWMHILTPSEIASQIADQSLVFLEADWRDLPYRQRSMRAVFDHSWRLLTEREQEVFARLSIFRGDFTAEAAMYVTAVSLRELMAFTSKSMLLRASPGRYAIHELLRKYGEAKLTRSRDGGKAVRDRHCAYYAAALETWGRDSKGPQQQEALAKIKTDIENARGAWNWAVAELHWAVLDRAVDGLCRLYEWQGRYHDGEIACRAAADRLEASGVLTAPGPGEALRFLVRIWTWQSVFCKITGRSEQARQLLQHSLCTLNAPVLADQDVRSEKAAVLRELGRTMSILGNRSDAGQSFAESLALFRALGDQSGAADVLAEQGQMAFTLGLCNEAKMMLKESLAIHRALGDRHGIAQTLRHLGSVVGDEGDLEASQRLIKESITICHEIDDRVGATAGLHGLAVKLMVSGKFAEARPLLEEAAAIYVDLGMHSAVADATEMLAWNLVNLAKYEQARNHAREALSLHQYTDNQPGIGYSLLGLSEVALAQETYSEARQLLEECVAVFREVDQQLDLGTALAELAHAALGLGQLDRARANLYEGLRTVAGVESFRACAFLVAKVALFLAESGESERAVELYALASRHPYIGESQYWDDIAGRHIATMSAGLPPETVEAARERGRTRDLGATVAELLAELSPS
jgi:predicted ATPase/DNA-binding SARP family transcriptional activator